VILNETLALPPRDIVPYYVSVVLFVDDVDDMLMFENVSKRKRTWYFYLQ